MSSFPTALIKQIPRLEARAAITSLVVGVLLLIVKFIAYFLTGSAAVFSDALESIVNVAAAGVALYALALAHSPADHEHPYGHGKIEFLSAGFEGGMILLAAFVIAFKAFDALLFQHLELHQLGAGLVLMAAAMLVNGALGVYLIALGRKQKSLTLEADGHHLLSDGITSAATLAALAIVRILHWPRADPLVALLIAAYIAWLGIRLLRRSAAGLMDEQDLEDEQMLKQLLDSHIGPTGAEPKICSYHKLRHRHSGRYHWVDFHIMMPANLTVRQSHQMASAIEYEIEQRLGEGKATAHVEPCPDTACPHCARHLSARFPTPTAQ
jgi:cation diffusion facilitator family transporter